MKQTVSIVFIVGGRSTEHDASLHSYQSFYAAIQNDPLIDNLLGVIYINREGRLFWQEDLVQPEEQKLQKGAAISWPDLMAMLLEKKPYCFSLLHGNEGEDGAFQGLAEILEIRGSFGSTFSAAITMNKWASSFGVPFLSTIPIHIPPTFIFDHIVAEEQFLTWISDHEIDKLIIKPNSMGASILTEVFDAKDTAKALTLVAEILKFCPHAIAQQYIPGDEYTCGCVQKREAILPLPILLAKSSTGFLGHEAKHNHGFIQAQFCEEETALILQLRKASVDLFRSFGLINMARFDFIVSHEDTKIYFLECNSIPGFGHGSAFPRMLARANMNLMDFLEQCLENERYGNMHRKTFRYDIKH